MEKNKPRDEVADRLTGRKLFSSNSTYPRLSTRYQDGAKVKKTLLTEEFSFQDFMDLYGETATPLMVIDENKSLRICTAEEEFTPKNGQTLISLVDRIPGQEDTA